MLLGDMGNPWIVTLRGGYRDEPSDTRPTVPEILGSTRLNSFTVPRLCPPTCNATNLAGDLPELRSAMPTQHRILTRNMRRYRLVRTSVLTITI
jgi:hypothetical protein